MFNADTISKRLGQCLDILFFRQPLRTTFGFLVGFIIYTCVYSFRLIIATNWFEVDSVHYTACFVLGILLVHGRTLVDVYRGTAIDEEINTLLNSISRRTDLSKEQKRMMIAEVLQTEISKLGKKGLEQVTQSVAEK
ncbi:hypothetical protein [Citrobacter freundii]|uniref:hypothetical protein n=1 Tax=Citrobacter freundii TaxID=546 RepID=UPI0023AFC97D|nr:hypothetical protein [Citrobacter freundii]